MGLNFLRLEEVFEDMNKELIPNIYPVVKSDDSSLVLLENWQIAPQKAILVYDFNAEINERTLCLKSKKYTTSILVFNPVSDCAGYSQDQILLLVGKVIETAIKNNIAEVYIFASIKWGNYYNKFFKQDNLNFEFKCLYQFPIGKAKNILNCFVDDPNYSPVFYPWLRG